MVPLAALWLPILLSAIIVFVASSVMHMLLPYHRSDYRQLPEEDRLYGVARRGLDARTVRFSLLHTQRHEIAGYC